MKPLSELVRYYNQLCDFSIDNSKQSTEKDMEYIIQLSQNEELKNTRVNVLSAFEKFESDLDQLRLKIYNQIREQERSYLSESYKNYEIVYEWFQGLKLYSDTEIQEEKLNSYVQTLLTRRLPIVPKSEPILEARVLRYSGWNNTGMIIRPGGIPNWVPKMVGLDPMYYVDESYELLRPVMSQFPLAYQNRLRPYIVREDREEDILWQLPDNQFGVVMAWNYFNHKPFEIIRRYLKELYKKMRPGSVLMMTYNDCDRWQGVLSAESTTGLYTPGSLILDFADSLGFEKIFSYHDGGPWTYVEFQKPGTRVSLRGSQPLAQILPKTVARSK